MRILILTSRFPYPLEKGDKLRIYHQIRGLSKSHEIHLVALSDKKVSSSDLSELKEFCQEVHLFRLSSSLVYLRIILAFLRKKSIQVAYFYNWFLKRKIKRMILDNPPDLIFCQLIRMSEYVKDIYHIPKCLDYMDAFSKGMQRQAEDSSGFKRFIFSKEALRLAAYEERIFHEFDQKTIISEQDRNYLELDGREEIKIIPNGVDVEVFKPLNLAKESDLLFVGNMSYYPNVKAAHFLAEKIQPLLVKDGRELKILISGANPSSSVKGLESIGLKIQGWVDSIVETYQKSRLFVAPLFHGSGLQNKILEAMACGLPVLTTSQTNNAIGARDKEQIWICDTEEQFIAGIESLLEDHELYQRLSQNARTFVESKYSWESCWNQLDQVIKECT